MKKKNQRPKKRTTSNTKKMGSTPKSKEGMSADVKSAHKKQVKQKPRRSVPKKVVSNKEGVGFSVLKYTRIAVRFLKEARMELKRVKWPTRKELLTSTAVVIVLTLIVAFYLGVVDFGLIKIIKVIVR